MFKLLQQATPLPLPCLCTGVVDLSTLFGVKVCAIKNDANGRAALAGINRVRKTSRGHEGEHLARRVLEGVVAIARGLVVVLGAGEQKTAMWQLDIR